ncbi:MAG: hypothetical protein GF388_02620 [Candidatus Aegiribacteria sp.]|nr:hypothetical protein [Candidatus Aegiribacteria sp.]MBD3294194.1 hypothetical protein [Candidatus Fermentibacteria bacterium]
MNIPKTLSAAAAVAALLSSACGGADPTSQEDNETVIPSDTLVLSDTVGVLQGDSLEMFGSLSEVLPVPEGIMILDRITCRITLFDREGNPLITSGGRGSGPGEYTNPFRMCRLAGGQYFVYEMTSGGTTLLDPCLNFIQSGSMNTRLPLKVAPGTDSMVVIKEIGIQFEEERLTGGYSIYSLNTFTGEEGCVYTEYIEPLGADEVDLRPHFCFFTTDTSGNVYLADYDSDEYSIRVLSPQGDPLDTLTISSAGEREEYHREIHSLRFLPITIPVSVSTEDGSSELKVTEPELQPYVSALAVGPEGNIWSRRSGVADSETWDVISPEGERLREVVLKADTAGGGYYPLLHISPFGLAATFSTEETCQHFFTVKQAGEVE